MDELATRDERRARETLAIYAAIGITNQAHGGGEKITADPVLPDDEHSETREYFYEQNCMTHGPTGPEGQGSRLMKSQIWFAKHVG